MCIGVAIQWSVAHARAMQMAVVEDEGGGLCEQDVMATWEAGHRLALLCLGEGNSS